MIYELDASFRWHDTVVSINKIFDHIHHNFHYKKRINI